MQKLKSIFVNGTTEESGSTRKSLLRLYRLTMLFTLVVLVAVGILVIVRFAVWKYLLGPVPDRHFEDVDRGVFFHHFAHRLIELVLIMAPFVLGVCLLLKNKDPAKEARFAMHLKFQLTICIVTLAIIFISNPFQLFWVNLVIGCASLVAFSRERFDADDYERLRMRVLLRTSVRHALYQIVILVLLLCFADKFIPGILSARDPVFSRVPTKHMTLVFCTFELMTLFNMFNCRAIAARKNIFKGLFNENRLFTLVWICLFFLHLIGLLMLFWILPFIYRNESLVRYFIFSKPLTFAQWLICFVLGVSVLLWGQLDLMISRKFDGHRNVQRVNPAKKNEK